MTDQVKLLSISELSQKVSFPKSTIYDWIKSGYFPSSIPFGEGKRKIVRWLESDVDMWIEKHTEQKAS